MFRSLWKQNRDMIALIFILLLWPNLSLATSFDEVYQSALQNSTSFARIKAESQKAKAESESENSKFLPRAGLEMRYENFESDFEKIRGGTANAFAEWNLFNGFKDLASKRILSAEAAIAQLNQERFERNLSWILKALYARAQASVEAVSAYQEIMSSNQKALESVRQRRASGRISESDLLEFELFDTRLKQELISFETEKAKAISELESFSGLSPLKQLSSELKPDRLNLDPLDLKQILSEKTSLLQDFRLRTEASEARRKLSLGGYLPELNLKATYGSMGLRETTVSPETSVALTAKWEIFSGFSTLNEQRSSSAEWIRSRAELAEKEILLVSRAEQLRQNLKNLLLRYDLEEKNQKNLERFLKAVQEEYRRGVKNSNDLKDALELSLQTKIARAQLRADYFAARAELQNILGRELE